MADNSLTAQDAASQSGTFDFDAPNVPAATCVTGSVGIDGAKTTDLIAVTVSSAYGGSDLSVTPEQASIDDVIRLLYCNPASRLSDAYSPAEWTARSSWPSC